MGDSCALAHDGCRGGGYWTPMLTAGVTWYIDSEKTWSVSALNRYEFNTEQRDTDITPGQAYTLEWGIAKSVTKTIDLGAVGYYQMQTTGGNVNGVGSRPCGRSRPGNQRGVPKANALCLLALPL